MKCGYLQFWEIDYMRFRRNNDCLINGIKGCNLQSEVARFMACRLSHSFGDKAHRDKRANWSLQF